MKLKNSWTTFFPDFQVPQEIITHPRLKDVAWGNDAMPYFQLDETDIYVFADHPVDGERECQGGKRFGIVRPDAGQVIIETDDLAFLIETLNDCATGKINIQPS